jgi:hypothetical protein
MDWFLQEDSVRGRREARSRRVRGASEPVVCGAPGVALRAQVHQRGRAERQGPARSRADGRQQGEGEADPERD